MQQLSLYHDEVVVQKQQMVQVVEEAYQMVPELANPTKAPTEVLIQRLALVVH